MKRTAQSLGVGLLALLCLVGLDFALAEQQPPLSPTATHDLIQPQTATASLFLPQRAGYYDTVWPSEHADPELGADPRGLKCPLGAPTRRMNPPV